MLKELNSTFGAMCAAIATTSLAINDGAAILRLKGVGAKQVAALEAATAIEAAKQNATQQQLQAAAELLAMVEEDLWLKTNTGNRKPA